MPGRRPRSRSVTKAGPPTAQNTSWRPPKVTSRRGSRAWSVNSAGACATSSSTSPSSSRTLRRSRSTSAPARARTSSARVSEHLDADLAEDPQRRPVDRLHLVGARGSRPAGTGSRSIRHGSWPRPGGGRRPRRWPVVGGHGDLLARTERSRRVYRRSAPSRADVATAPPAGPPGADGRGAYDRGMKVSNRTVAIVSISDRRGASSWPPCPRSSARSSF